MVILALLGAVGLLACGGGEPAQPPVPAPSAGPAAEAGGLVADGTPEGAVPGEALAAGAEADEPAVVADEADLDAAQAAIAAGEADAAAGAAEVEEDEALAEDAEAAAAAEGEAIAEAAAAAGGEAAAAAAGEALAEADVAAGEEEEGEPAVGPALDAPPAPIELRLEVAASARATLAEQARAAAEAAALERGLRGVDRVDVDVACSGGRCAATVRATTID